MRVSGRRCYDVLLAVLLGVNIVLTFVLYVECRNLAALSMEHEVRLHVNQSDDVKRSLSFARRIEQNESRIGEMDQREDK